MFKYAYLIIAHSNYEVLRNLLFFINRPYNDIFLHIDKKSPLPQWLSDMKSNNLILIKDRVDVRWGDFSQIEVEMKLFETAYNHEQNEYFHLLSGVDLPIKSQEYIYDFFQKNKGKEFVGFSQEKVDNYIDRVDKYHFLTRYYKVNSFVLKLIRRLSEYITNSLVKRGNKEKIEFKRGANWVSISHDFCGYLLSKKSYIFKRFKHTYCTDEMFLQTILWNSPFRKNIYSLSDEFNGCLREIDWNRGGPYIWGQDKQDLDILAHSNKLFARKFDETLSKKLILELKDLIDKRTINS